MSLTHTGLISNDYLQLLALEKEHYKHDEEAPSIPSDKMLDKNKHTSTKGIQGYKNSCYLDATLYGMFMFSDAFDVLLKGNSTTNAEELHLQNILKREIVYPLRKLVKHDVHTIPTHSYLPNGLINAHVW